MKPLRKWLARLAFVGAWAVVSGCGSGDLPDPSSDGSAQIPGQSAPPELTPPPAAENPQVASAAPNSEEATPEEPAAPEVAAPVESAAAVPAAAAAPASSGGPAGPDKNSATAELLALSNKEPQPAPSAAGDAGASPAAGAGGPAGGPGPGGPGPGGGPPGMAPNAGGMMGGGMMGGGMQGMMQQQQQQQQQMMQQMQGQMQGQMKRGMGGPGGPGGMMAPGGPGAPGGGSSKAPDFRTPQGAVNAFLDALKEKDLGRLTDATALRAPAESKKYNEDMFTRILDGTYSKEEIDKLADYLDGYKVSGFNQAKSTGRLGVILSKKGQNRSILKITITARREKKGWGVCDISRPMIIKSPQFGFKRRSTSSSNK